MFRPDLSVYIISLYWYIVVYWRKIIHYTNLLLHNRTASVKLNRLFEMWFFGLWCHIALEVDSNTSKKRISLILGDNVSVPIGLPLPFILQIMFLVACLYNPTAFCQWTSAHSSKTYTVSHSSRLQYILKTIGSKTYTKLCNYTSVKKVSFTVGTEIFTGTAHTNENCFINSPKLFKSPSSSCHISLCDNILISIFHILEY